MTPTTTTPQSEEAYPIYHPPEPIEFVTVARIHPNMPEFTFRRIIGAYLGNENDIPHATEVTIIIENENGEVIQILDGLTQNYFFLQPSSIDFLAEVTLLDLTFNGYKDMVLARWPDSGQSMRMVRYVWLWNTKTSQFELNNQLTDLWAADIIPHPDNEQIQTWIRNSDGWTNFFYIFDIDFILSHSYRTYRRLDSYGQPDYIKIVRHDYLTGDVLIEIEPFSW